MANLGLGWNKRCKSALHFILISFLIYQYTDSVVWDVLLIPESYHPTVQFSWNPLNFLFRLSVVCFFQNIELTNLVSSSYS